MQYNWTWVSIVGWPFYYASNTALFSSSQNTWGIYGMNMMGKNSADGAAGLNSFLEGIDNQPYVYGDSTTSSPGIVSLSNEALDGK